MRKERAEDAAGRAARVAIRKWVRTVLEETGWSAEEWARKATTSPTNITRILAAEQFSLPNADTLVKLAHAAGSQPDLVGRKAVPAAAKTVPLLDREQALQYAMARYAEAYLALVRQEFPEKLVYYAEALAAKKAFAVELECNSLWGRDVRKGDLVIVQPGDLSAKNFGAIVAAVVNGRIGAWLFYPPKLVPASELHGTVDWEKDKGTVLLGAVVQLVKQVPAEPTH